MELDLNKEMEVLLRRAREGGSSLPAGPHLDADTISAFAANAIPAAARASCVSHLADCTRCRTILADLVSNREEPSEAPSKELTVATAPWYSRLLTIPKMTYVTAALVIAIGLVSVFLVTRDQRPAETEVSKSFEPETKSASTGTDGRDASASSENSTPSSNSPVTPSASPNQSEIDVPLDTTGILVNSESQTPMPISETTAPAPLPIETPTPETTQAAPEEKVQSVPLPTPATPTSEQQQTARTADAGAGDKARESKSKAAELFGKMIPGAAMMKRAKPTSVSVEGRTFVKEKGVWTDTQYSGASLTVVTRGSEEFNKLDAGLREIASKISGAVIVVWKGRAYRIQ